MSGDAPVTDKAIKTPVYAKENSWEVTTIYDASGVPLCVMSLRHFLVTEKNQAEWERRQQAKAALIVAAVNSYDEARALLREAADWIDHLSSGDCERDESEDFIARIRAFLEKPEMPDHGMPEEAKIGREVAQTEKLLSCPFCGGEAVTFHDPHGEGVTCIACFAVMDTRGYGKAIAQWNTRATTRAALPACMAPDGADPCTHYRALKAENERLREALKPFVYDVLKQSIIDPIPTNIPDDHFYHPSIGATATARDYRRARAELTGDANG